jgi:hypothetical protein
MILILLHMVTWCHNYTLIHTGRVACIIKERRKTERQKDRKTERRGDREYPVESRERESSKEEEEEL